MSEKQTGGPAFPTLEEHGFNQGEPGMTLRDYFAAKAMQGMLAATPHDHAFDSESIVEAAYETADAMLKARSA